MGRVDTAEGRRLLAEAREQALEASLPINYPAQMWRSWLDRNADGLLAAAEERDTLRDFYESWLAVQGGLIDFDLHTDAVERLKTAQKAVDLFRAGTEQPA